MKWKLSSLSHLTFLVLSGLSFCSFQLNEAPSGRRVRKQYPLPLARVNNCIVFLISTSNLNRVLSIHDRWQDSEGKLLLLPSPLNYPPPLLFPSPTLWPTRIKISCGTVVFKKLDQVFHVVVFFAFYFILFFVLRFSGVPSRSTVLLQPTTHCLVNITEQVFRRSRKAWMELTTVIKIMSNVGSD